MITEKLTRGKKIVLMTVVVVYFVVGFVAVVIFLGRVVGANTGGVIAILYLVAGWYFMIKRNGLFYAMRIKHD